MADAVNSSGEIVGSGTYWNGTTDETQAFLLTTPTPTPAPTETDVPGMPPWGLAILGGLLLITAAKSLPRYQAEH